MRRGPYGKNKILFEKHNSEIRSLRLLGYGYKSISVKLKVPFHLVIYCTKDLKIVSGKSQSDIQRELWLMRHNKICWDELPKKAKRFRVFQEQGGACLWCMLTMWRGKPIPLELDHVDGNRENEKRENVRLLCGNCHSQTPTFSGKNLLVSKNQYGVFPRKKCRHDGNLVNLVDRESAV